MTVCGHHGRETDQNRVAAEVYGAGNNTRHEDRKHAVTAKKSQKRVSWQKKLGETEVLFV
jgi:hypothetical protein